MKCNTCAYWANHRTHVYNGKVHDMTDYYKGWVRNPLPGDYGICGQVYSNKAMCICDGEGINGQLITHESFGCSEYKAKENSDSEPIDLENYRLETK